MGGGGGEGGMVKVYCISPQNFYIHMGSIPDRSFTFYLLKLAWDQILIPSPYDTHSPRLIRI